jgi:multidrug transporter EmrE-like cation transporter
MFILIIVLAAVSYSVGGYYMKLSNGFNQFGPTALVFMLFCLGAGLQTWAMRNEQMTVTYILVLGLEAVIAFGLGVFLLNESSSALKVAGTLFILVGIVLLRLA